MSQPIWIDFGLFFGKIGQKMFWLCLKMISLLPGSGDPDLALYFFMLGQNEFALSLKSGCLEVLVRVSTCIIPRGGGGLNPTFGPSGLRALSRN
jgi:hypothetical protein